MNQLMFSPVYNEVSFDHGMNVLNPSLLVYTVTPINCLTDLTPTYR